MQGRRGGPDVCRLERRGNTYILSAARFGDTLSAVEAAGLPLGDTFRAETRGS